MAAYTYDSRNRLTGVLNLSYEYDAENNRIASTDSQTGKTIRYIHNTNSDLSQLLVEEDGTTTTKYIYGNELISAKTYEKSLEELKEDGAKATASTTYYYHYDNLKSTTLLTDATGEVVETYDYGTYGEATDGDTTLSRFLYNGGLGVSSDSNGLYYMRARYYNPAIRRFINQDVETGSMDDSASLNRYAYVQGNPISLTDPFGLSPDMEYGNYEANALKSLFKVANKVADYLPVVGTARDIKRSYNAFKNGNIADGIKHGATAALALAGPTAKVMKSAMKLAKNSLKLEKCLSKIAQIASEGIKLAGKAVRRVGDVGKKVAKTVKNGVCAVARTVKRELIRVYKDQRGIAGFGVDIKFRKKGGNNTGLKEFDIIPYGKFKDYPGDGLTGHELLQNAWLEANGKIPRRGVGLSTKNPVIALRENPFHKFISRKQKSLGLNKKNLAGISWRKNVLDNIQIMKDAGVPRDKIAELAWQTRKFAIDNGF